MVRPSFKDTLSESAEKLTPATRSSAFNAKMPIPTLNKHSLILFYQRRYCTKFLGGEPEVSRKCHWLQPKSCRQIISINANVARLIGFVAIEIKSVWAASEDGRHGRILQNCAYSRTGID